MSNQINLKGVLCTLLLFFFLIPNTQASIIVNNTSPACTIGSGNYSTIQVAVNIATQGETILVCPGVYTENVDINQQLSIIGYSLDALQVYVKGVSAVDAVFEVKNSSTTIAFLTMNGSTAGLNPTVEFNSNFTNLSYNRFIGDAHQVSSVVAAPRIYGIIIHNNFFQSTPSTSASITLYTTDSSSIYDNTINGTYQSTSSVFSLRSNTNNIIIHGNDIHVNNTDAVIDNRVGNTNNTFYNNTVNLSSGAYVDNVPIFGPQVQINMNTTIGNYWWRWNGSGYSDTCTDLTQDGICDSPYTLSGTIPDIDYHPLRVNMGSTPTPSSIEQSFGNISEVLHETPRIIPPLVSLLFYILIIILLFIVIKFYKQILENITNIISDIGR